MLFLVFFSVHCSDATVAVAVAPLSLKVIGCIVVNVTVAVLGVVSPFFLQSPPTNTHTQTHTHNNTHTHVSHIAQGLSYQCYHILKRLATAFHTKYITSDVTIPFDQSVTDNTIPTHVHGRTQKTSLVSLKKGANDSETAFHVTF